MKKLITGLTVVIPAKNEIGGLKTLLPELKKLC